MNSRIIKVISLFALVIFTGCFTPKVNKVSEIIVGLRVNQNYFYSDESQYMINGIQYSLRYKVTYKKGQLVEFKKYLPEGVINYSLDELKNDTAITNILGVPFQQNWICNKDKLRIIKDKIAFNLVKLDDVHFKESSSDFIYVLE